MKRVVIFIVFVLLFFCVFAFAADPPVNMQKKEFFPRALMERSPGNFDPAAYLQEMRDKYNWLLSEAAPLSPGSFIAVHGAADELERIDDSECRTCEGTSRSRLRVGVTRPLNVDVSFNGFTPGTLPDQPMRHSTGMMRRTADGGLVWTIALHSKDASALRVHLSDFSLPANAALHIYSEAEEAFGPYTDLGPNKNGDFWTNTVMGALVYVQLRCFGPISQQDFDALRFKISAIGHLGPKFLLPFREMLERDNGNIDRAATHCPYNAPCVEDARCIDGYTFPAIDYVRWGVARIQWVSGSNIYICSGGLLTDLVPESQIPYFLTANHCIGNDSDAQSLECFFQYWTPYCHGPCWPIQLPPRTLGATFLSGSKTNGDYSLLVLKEDPPPGSIFLGWETAPVAFYHLVDLFRLHHPKGAPQAFSRYYVDTTLKECSGKPSGKFIYSRNIIGADEYGSDGAPVVSIYGLVCGQLSGVCVYKPFDLCDYETYATLDGALASYFDEIVKWLIPY